MVNTLSGPFQTHLTCFNFSHRVVHLGGRFWEPFYATITHQLGHLFRHISLVLDQNVLMLDVKLTQFEVKHFHNFLEIVVTSFHNFLGLLEP